MKKKSILHIDAVEEKDGTFNIRIDGKGFDKKSIKILFNVLQKLAETIDTFITFPVIRSIEDPVWMTELDKRMKDNTKKCLSMEEFKNKMKEKFLTHKKCNECNDIGEIHTHNEQGHYTSTINCPSCKGKK